MSDEFDPKRCTKTEFLVHLRNLVATFQETQKVWEKVKPGQHFFRTNAYYDYFHHEVKEVHPDTRTLVVIDHSLDGKEETWEQCYIHIYDFYDTYEELRENTDFKHSVF